MVVSLESQNVKIRKPYYNKTGKINIDTSFIYKNLANLKITGYLATYICSLFLFSFIFYKCGDFFIPHRKVTLNVHSITLPNHKPDIVSKENIINYKGNKRNDLYTNYSYTKTDTLSSVAIKYNISTNTILHVNNIEDIRDLVPGIVLKVPSVDGLVHNITSKDSLESLSYRYGVAVKDIFRINNLRSETLVEGNKIFIPNVDISDTGWKSNIDKFFVYPVKGQIIRRYGHFTNKITGMSDIYEGVDFRAGDDKSVLASKSGHISRIGYNPNYGNYIFIDHNGGFRTLYAHLNNINVSNRDKVEQGDVLGTVGDSGFAKKEKLFFCILNKDVTVNPESYLK